MFSVHRRAVTLCASARAFSSSANRSSDLAKLTLIGRLGKDPEVRVTRNDKEYVSYSVATTNFPPPPPNPDGTRPPSTTTWHHILSFNPTANAYLRNLQKGTQVYVEANFELREPGPDADPDTPQGQRQIFLRHENIRFLRAPNPNTTQTSTTSEESS